MKFSVRRKPRGSIMTLAIVLAVVFTALVSAMAWVAGEAAQRTGALSKIDQAFYAAETGAQRVEWFSKNGKMGSIASPLTGTVNGYSYTTSWSTVSGSTIAVTSVGSMASVSYTLSEQIAPPTSGAGVIQSGGDFDNKNIDVTGNAVIGGNYSDGGSGSLTGNLTYYGTASGTGSVTGTVTQASGSPTTIDFTALGTTLSAAAGQTYSGTQSGTTFNFSALPGTNKVIYVNGSVSSPTFIGSGTLYVSGTVSVDGFGTSGSPVNIVAGGAVTTSNNITVYGSLYTPGAWSRGKMDWTGLIYAAGTINSSNNGHSTLTMGTAPWFDPRAGGGGGGNGSPTSITKFTGPLP